MLGDWQVCFALMNEDCRWSGALTVPSGQSSRAIHWVGPGFGRDWMNSGFCFEAEPAGGPASNWALPSAMATRASASSLPAPPASQSTVIPGQWGLTCLSISKGKHVISGHAWCHLEGSSGFSKWKQCALKVIMGWEACSGVRPSIYKQRLPFLPGDRTT